MYYVLPIVKKTIHLFPNYMEIIEFFSELIANPDLVLSSLVILYSQWIYLFLFLMIFAETGLVILSFLMPFLPGDALLFSVGIVAGKGELNIYVIIPLLILAAILGDNLNYFIGRKFGNWFVNKRKLPILKPHHLAKAEVFFEKNEKKSIIIARFIPVVRTIVPFLSGATRLSYPVFLFYSLIGALIWVFLLVFSGYLLGQFDWVKNHLNKVILIIIIIANIPLIRQIFFKIKIKLK